MALSRQQLEELRAHVEAERDMFGRANGPKPSVITREAQPRPSNATGLNGGSVRSARKGSTSTGSSGGSFVWRALSHIGWLIPLFFILILGDWLVSRHLEQERLNAKNVRIVNIFRESRKVGATLRLFTFQWRSLENKPNAYSLERMNDFSRREDLTVQDTQVLYRSKDQAVNRQLGSFEHAFWYGDFVRLDMRFDSDRRFYCVYFIDSKGFTIPMNGAYNFCSSNRTAIINARDAIVTAHSAWRNSHREVVEIIGRLEPYQVNRLR